MILQLLFLLLIVLWALSCFWPNWSGPFVFGGNAVIRFVVGLVVLVILYLLVGALLGAAG